jgi:hypothetical protein
MKTVVSNQIYLLTALILCSCLLSAQETEALGHGPYLKATGSFAVSLGYRLGAGFGGGYDHRFAKALFLSDAMFDTADKVDAPGSTMKGGAGFYFMKKRFGAGGGGRCTRLMTSVYGKASCRPFVGGVYEGGNVRFDAAYLASGTDRVNHLHGLRTVTVFALSRNVQMELETGFYRFRSSLGTRRYFGFVMNPGIRYRF